VRTRSRDDGAQRWTEQWTGFDQLVLATGAQPLRPALPGFDAPGVHGVQTLADGEALLATLARDCHRAVVVGGGYIGVEMAEAMVRRGLVVTMVHRSPEPMATLDPDMGRLVREAMVGMGIEVVPGAEAKEVLLGPDGRPRAVLTSAGEHPADVVVLGLGVRPRTELARAAGLPLGASGGLRTNPSMQVQGPNGVVDGIWAGGDCVEVLNLVSGRHQHIALGTHANKHGLVIGTNIGGGRASFPGVVGTAVSKVCSLEIARTGLREREVRAAGLSWDTAVIESTSRAGYYPGAAPMTVKMIAERDSGRVLGLQIVGREGAAKRVDIGAVALTAGMTVQQVVALDLGYAPPFSPVWDPVQVAARKLLSGREFGG
jgi:NADPH-dependent 2,4-dienoyl-CoA reductase/sulfur reductase-like enzyme